MIEGLDFDFIVNDNDKEYVHVRMLTGPYSGVIYRYGKVKLTEKNDELHLHFDFDVIQSPQVKAKSLEKDPDFKNYIGGFLISIIQGNIEQEFVDEIGTDDFKESDL